jgi:hypothetical protein
MRITGLPHCRLLLLLFLLSQFLHSCGLVEEPVSSTSCISNCSSTTTLAPTEDSTPVSPGSATQAVGVFKDGAVAGINFESSSGLTGITNSSGEFDYREGDRVSFTLGGIDLGSVTGAAVLTPVEVMEATGTADPKVVNFARFLQSIDDDGDPTNGINITSSTSSSLQNDRIDFDQPVAAFAEKARTLVRKAYSGRELISESDALNHLHNTLEDEGKADKVSPPDDFAGIVENYTPEVDKWPLLLDDTNGASAVAGSYELFLDPNGQVYLARHGFSEQCSVTISKYNSKRTAQWDEDLCINNLYDFGEVPPVVDNNGNIYVLEVEKIEVGERIELIQHNSRGEEISRVASSCHTLERAYLGVDGTAYLWGQCLENVGLNRSLTKLNTTGKAEETLLNESDIPEVPGRINGNSLIGDNQGNLFWEDVIWDSGTPGTPSGETGVHIHMLYALDTKGNFSSQRILETSATASSALRLIRAGKNAVYVLFRSNDEYSTYGYTTRLQKYNLNGPVWKEPITLGIKAEAIEVWDIVEDRAGNLIISGTAYSFRTADDYSFIEKRSGKDGELLRRKWLGDSADVYSIAMQNNARFYTLTEAGNVLKVEKWGVDNLTVNAVNPPIVLNGHPVAEEIGPFEALKNTQLVIQLSGSDPEGDEISFHVESPLDLPPDHADITYDTETGVVNYTTHDRTGSNTFSYYVVDEYGAYSEPVAVEIEVFEIQPEPAYSVDNFTVVANNSSTITTSWDLYPDNGSQAPQGFLLICSADNNTQPPTDNISLADDPDCSDGAGAVNIAATETSYTWSNLQGDQQYFFQIFAMTNTDRPQYIDYLTSGFIQAGDVVTPSAGLPVGIFDESLFDESVFAE